MVNAFSSHRRQNELTPDDAFWRITAQLMCLERRGERIIMQSCRDYKWKTFLVKLLGRFIGIPMYFGRMSKVTKYLQCFFFVSAIYGYKVIRASDMPAGTTRF